MQATYWTRHVTMVGFCCPNKQSVDSAAFNLCLAGVHLRIQLPFCPSMVRRILPSDLTDSNRLVPDSMINVFRVDGKTVVKLCDPNRLIEAETLRFIRSKTSLPVPEIYDAYVDETLDRGVIVMEYIEGDVLRDVIDDMDDAGRLKIVSDLAKYMLELRSIKGDFIGSIDCSACEDPIFCAEPGGFGPYQTEDEFNEGLIWAMTLDQKNSWIDHIAKLIRAMPPHEINLTHADLSPRNIIVSGDQVAGILDWEMAGFYPEYWEYIKALYHPDWQSSWVNEGIVDTILEPYYLEHAVMLHMQEAVW